LGALHSPAGQLASGADGDLRTGLDFPLPESLKVGAGTAVFVCGWCFAPSGPIGELELVVDGDPQPLMAFGMPRGDVLEALRGDDPEGLSYRSGFWGVAQVAPGPAGGRVEIALRARVDGGREQLAPIGRIERAGGERPLAGGPSVAICMATYEPPMDLFRRQVDSIRAQTHTDWVCVVSDDCSSPARFEEMRAVLAGDDRFVLSRAPRRLGFYANFERALELAPADAGYVALADQDDVWHPDKLATLLEEIGPARLIYSDARIVATDGRLVSETYWPVRRNNHTSLFSLLVANSVTGAASLFPRDLLDSALPFPPAQFAHFHDHWLALTALALGEISFVDRPLYDYTQHAGAVLGHDEANRMPTMGDRVRGLRRPLRERAGLWRFTYFVDACRLTQFATVLRLRCGDRMKPAKRRELERFTRADRNPLGLAPFTARAARELVGRPETLGAELGLMFGFGWRHLCSAAARGAGEPRRRVRIDSRPPPKIVVKPGRRDPDVASVGEIAAKIAPLELHVTRDAPPRVNLLIPTIDLKHFFGGYLGKFNLARRLADRGARVRIVTVDPVGPLPPSWRETIESYSGLGGFFDRVEVAFGRESGLDVSPSDSFVASTWWTAHIAHEAVAAAGGERFLYLIQEYEPFTFPMGTYAALAEDSYRLPHFALFSTELLRDFFRRRGIGVYAEGAGGDDASAAFQNAITAVDPPAPDELRARTSRKLLFYARPEPHAARNMFELGALALSRAVDDGAIGPDWELYGIGTVEGRRRVGLGGGAVLEMLPRQEQSAYAGMLREHDVGLALMYTPHPSLVPIEMASAGLLTVTTSFENKTPAAMAAISSNLITVEPSIRGVVGGLREAVAAVDQVERRAAGAHVDWSRNWADSFPDELMQRVEGFLRR
jgi:hypothetical protein